MSIIKFTAAEIAVLSAFNDQNAPDAVQQKLAELNRITSVLAEAKNVAGNAATEKGNAWTAILDVMFAVADATSATPNIRELVFNSVLGEYVGAEKTSAKASLKAYISTARNAMLKLLDVSHTAEQIAQASYKEVREALSPKADADFSAKVAKLRENMAYVEKNIVKVKGAANGAEQLALLHSTLDDLLETAQAMRDTFKAETDDASHRANMARALHDLKPQAPTAPTNVEVAANAA